MVATLHGYVHARKFSKMWFYELLDRFAITFLQGVVLVGESMRVELPAGLSTSSKVQVISNGLDVESIDRQGMMPLARQVEEFISTHSPIVLGIGRLSKEKGFDRLVGAFRSVCDRFENAGLVIVGEGRLRNNLEANVQQLGLKERVLMPGYCNNVPALLRRSNLLVVPSVTEGLPIVLLEAMAQKLPVLVSPVGEMPEVLGFGKGGVILSGDFDCSMLASYITKALQDAQSAHRVDWSVEKVRVDYSIATTERSYRDLYTAVCGGMK